jgi:hypothetical protein
VKYLPSPQIQAELVRHGLEQFCPGIELDDQELGQLVAEYSAHPAHAKETEPEILIEQRTFSSGAITAYRKPAKPLRM